MINKKSSKIVVSLIGLLAVFLVSQSAAFAEVTFRTIGSARDADYLIRRNVMNERVDHDSLRGTVHRTASERRPSSRLSESARRRVHPEFGSSPQRFGTVSRTASERLARGEPAKSARATKSISDFRQSPVRSAR